VTAKVIPIRGHELIPVLEEWLEQAKRGEIKAMAFAAIMDDETTCEGWAGSVDQCCLALFAAINILRDGYFHQHIDHYSSSDRGAT
jgi:hypothetical protein